MASERPTGLRLYQLDKFNYLRISTDNTYYYQDLLNVFNDQLISSTEISKKQGYICSRQIFDSKQVGSLYVTKKDSIYSFTLLIQTINALAPIIENKFDYDSSVLKKIDVDSW